MATDDKGAVALAVLSLSQSESAANVPLLSTTPQASTSGVSIDVQSDRRKPHIRFSNEADPVDDSKGARPPLPKLTHSGSSDSIHSAHSGSSAGYITQPQPLASASTNSGSSNGTTNTPRAMGFAPTPPIYCRLFSGHKGAVTSVAFSADGRRIASAGGDETVRIWDSVTGAMLHSLAGHTGGARKVTFAENGILYALDGAGVKVWEPVTGNRMNNMNKQVDVLCFSYDGRLMATARDREATLFEAVGGTQLHTISTDEPITCMTFALTSRDVLAMGLEDGSTRIFHLNPANVATLAQTIPPYGQSRLNAVVSNVAPVLHLPPSPPESPRSDSKSRSSPQRINSIALSPDASILATASADGYAMLWDVQAGELLHELRVPASTDIGSDSTTPEAPDVRSEMLSIAFAPVSPDLPGINARLLATADAAGFIRLWDGETGAFIRTLSRTLAGSTAFGSIAFASSGRILVSGSSDGGVRVWDWHSPPLLASFPGHSRPIAQIDVFSPSRSSDSPTILGSVSSDGFFKVWNAVSGDLIHAAPPPMPSRTSIGSIAPNSALTCVAYYPVQSPDGWQVAVGGEDGRIRFLDQHGAKEYRSITPYAQDVETKQALSAICHLSFSPDGVHLAAIGRQDGILSLIHIPSMETVQQIRAAEFSDSLLVSAAWSNDSQVLACATNLGVISLYRRAQAGGPTRQGRAAYTAWKNLFGATDAVPQMAFSMHGRLLAAACHDSTAYMFNVRDGSVVHTLRGHRGAVTCLAFFESSLLATGCDDGNIYLWSTASGALLYLFDSHTDAVTSLVFSTRADADETTCLFSSARDCTIMKWDVDVTRREPPLSYTRRLFQADAAAQTAALASSRGRGAANAFSDSGEFGLSQSVFHHRSDSVIHMVSAFAGTTAAAFNALLHQHRVRLLADFPGIVNEREPQSMTAIGAAMSLMAKRRQSRRTLGGATPTATPRKSELVLLKLQGSASEQSQSQVGRTLLHFVTARRNADILRELLQSPAARALVLDENGLSPLDIAVRIQDLPAISLWLKHIPALYLHARLPFVHLLGILAQSYPQLLLQTLQRLHLERASPLVQGSVKALEINETGRRYAGSPGAQTAALWDFLSGNNKSQASNLTSNPGSSDAADPQFSPRAAASRFEVAHADASNNKGISLLPLIAKSQGKVDAAEEKRKIRELERAARQVPVVATVVGIPHLAKHWPHAKENPLRVFVALGLSGVLETPAVRNVLEYKWEKFGRRLLLFRFVTYILFLTLFTIATVGYTCHSANYSDGGWGVVRAIIDLITVILAFYFWVLEMLALWERGFWDYFKSPWSYLDLIGFTLVLLNIPFRLACWSGEEVVESLAAIALWLKLIYFARGFRALGPFVAVLLIVIEQLTGFFLVLATMIAAFAHALFLLARSQGGGVFDQWNSLLSVYNAVLGGTQTTAAFNASSVPGLSIAYYVVFTALTTIIMLSLLVALITRIYASMDARGVNHHGWVVDRARLLLDLEDSSLSSRQKQDTHLFPTWLHVLVPTSVLATPSSARSDGNKNSLAGEAGSDDTIASLQAQLRAVEISLETRLAAQLAPTAKLVAALHARAVAPASTR